ncbi:hypothetical protein [Rickettsia endosymbiont of Cardiosporidium cionae]|uniref:hypothetical protein n=1 Tax=Rickettsia endosymbiont of Cardiosporidium cionae TaxID=2777155 RepID=UPI001894E599|nr:hypothetical protein [Rickettsia endosymbiont of Cardiosporidium cionae]KAF8818640.1 hypothetical protein IHI24_000362 [Rickettsia endosymbiont of Cardiosporidium cionae]
MYFKIINVINSLFYRVVIFFLGVVALFLFTINYNSFILFILIIIPSLLVLVINVSKNMSYVVVNFNLIGILPFLLKLFSSSNVEGVILDYISTKDLWYQVYFTTAVGLMIYFILPIILKKIYKLFFNVRIYLLTTQYVNICDRWGINADDDTLLEFKKNNDIKLD